MHKSIQSTQTLDRSIDRSAMTPFNPTPTKPPPSSTFHSLLPTTHTIHYTPYHQHSSQNGTLITSPPFRRRPVSSQNKPLFLSLPPPWATTHFLFDKNNRAWNKKDWTTSDDRVRGGASTSTLTCSPSSLTALFHGNLDITALGGAGFASQRTAAADRVWDLSGYDGLEVVVDLDRTDGKVYTFTVKDEILPRRGDGRERSSVSWEVDFCDRGDRAAAGKKTFFVKWDDLRPTFRGREVEGVEPLDLRRVRRFGVMIRRCVLLVSFLFWYVGWC